MLTKASKLRPAASVKPYAKKPRQNSAFKKHKISYSGKVNEETPWGQHLKTIKQLPFEDVLKMDQKKAKAFLTNTGVLSSDNKHLTFTCWACNETIHRAKGEHRCQPKHCSSRSRITQPALAYSPVYMQASGGETPDYVGLVRVTYVLGLKLQNDAALHLVRRPNDTLDSGPSTAQDQPLLQSGEIGFSLFRARAFQEDNLHKGHCRTGYLKAFGQEGRQSEGDA